MGGLIQYDEIDLDLTVGNVWRGVSLPRLYRLDIHRPASRAEVVAILLSVFHLPVALGLQPLFSDIQAGHAYVSAIATASFYGLVQGNPDGTFRPDDPINRAETAKIIALMMELLR